MVQDGGCGAVDATKSVEEMMAGEGIVIGCGEGLKRNRAATRITGRNDAANDEPGETGSLGHVTNPFCLVRYRGCFRDWMQDDLINLHHFFLLFVMTAFFSLTGLTRIAGDGFLIKRSSGTMQFSGPCRIFYEGRFW